MNTANLAAALTLASRGVRVFPCLVAGKEPAVAHGCHAATVERSLIYQWWNTCADFNVAAATGAISGFFCVDVDGIDAEEEMRKLEVQYGEPLPPTIETITARGRHAYFKHPGPEHRITNSTSKLAPGIDIKGDDGYVLMPPSTHPSGRKYAWSVDCAPALAAPPRWLLEQIAAPRNAHKVTPPEEWRRMARDGVAQGQRNQSAARLAGMLLRRSVDPLVVLELLQCWNVARCAPPLEPEEIAAVVDSICQRELRSRGAGT